MGKNPRQQTRTTEAVSTKESRKNRLPKKNKKGGGKKAGKKHGN